MESTTVPFLRALESNSLSHLSFYCLRVLCADVSFGACEFSRAGLICASSRAARAFLWSQDEPVSGMQDDLVCCVCEGCFGIWNIADGLAAEVCRAGEARLSLSRFLVFYLGVLWFDCRVLLVDKGW